jgi:hypothetical protein
LVQGSTGRIRFGYSWVLTEGAREIAVDAVGISAKRSAKRLSETWDTRSALATAVAVAAAAVAAALAAAAASVTVVVAAVTAAEAVAFAGAVAAAAAVSAAAAVAECPRRSSAKARAS